MIYEFLTFVNGRIYVVSADAESFSRGVWGGEASPGDFSGGCGAAKPRHNHQK
jgi:hypothetical protein